MITEISIENYLSIKDKIVFNLNSTASKNLEQNLIKLTSEDNVLKTAVIYGANASGKSNLIKSVFYIWFLVKNSHLFNVETKLNKIIPPRTPFKLDSSCLKKPSKFEIIFINDNIKYKYGFSCDNTKIIDEYLYYWPKGREALIFNRTNSTEFKFTNNKTQQEVIKKQMNENVLYLSRATQLGYNKTRSAYEFIINNIVINPNRSDLTIKEIYENKESKRKFIEILRKADFGGILDLEVSKEKKKINGFEFKFENKLASVNEIKDKDEDFFNVKFIHEDKNKNPIKLAPQEESTGTIKILEMLGPIFDVLQTGKTMFIDEFELNLHPNITEFLIKLFHSKHNTNNGQLIITTHDTTLLKYKNLFRRDQVYICSKAPNKWTEINSLADFDLRESLSFENAYLNGRVGGLPFIDETFFED